MPEASVNEDDRTKSGENKIRCSWEVRPVKPVSEPKRVERLPQGQLWLRVFTPNQRHAVRSLGGRAFVEHADEV